jgi:hypothetical protein
VSRRHHHHGAGESPAPPHRSESAPQTIEPTPMQRKLRSAAVEMPVRDQSIAAAMGWRKTLSESIAPCPMQVTMIPTPTTIHRTVVVHRLAVDF